MDFLVTMISTIPADADPRSVEAVHRGEIARTVELGRQHHMLRLWTPPKPAGSPPSEIRTLGLFRARDAGELETLLQSLPMHVWSRFEIVELRPHAHDPGDDTAVAFQA